MNISVIITNLNMYHETWFTLQSVIAELRSTGCQYEIIIADNGSVEAELDPLRALVERVAKYHDIKLVVWDRIKSAPGIRTAGMMEAKYDLVVFMDGHIILDHDYFKKNMALFDDPDVFVVLSPEIYYAEPLYEYTIVSQLHFGKSTLSWNPKSTNPYPVSSSCQACTMIRRDFLKFMFPEDELNYIPYSLDEPYTPLLAWMFGKKVLMNPNTYFAHRPWAMTPGGNCDYESWRPLGAYALAGNEGYQEARANWPSTKELILPEKHREFIEKNAVVKYKDLPQYLNTMGVID